MTRILAFFDESGDMGWKFDAPFREGGSSRKFIIGAALGSDNINRKLSKTIRRLWETQGWTSKNEKKWNGISDKAKRAFAELAAEMAQNNPDVKMCVAVLAKQDLPVHLRPDQHLLYAHLATNLIADELTACTQASICPDELNAGTGSANLLQHLMRHEMWFRRNCTGLIEQKSTQKAFVQALEFCDMLSGAAAAHFEDGRSEPWDILKPFVKVKEGW